MLKIDGFDDALIGTSSVWRKTPGGGAKSVRTLVYDGERIITVLFEQSGMSYDEAIEYISFKIEGAYVGETTPIIVWPCSMDEVKGLEDE